MLTVMEYRTLFLHLDLKNGFHQTEPISLKPVIMFVFISKTVAATSTPIFLTDD